MNTIQEALRELMIRKKDANKTNKEQSIQINEDKKIYHNGDEYLKEEALAKKKEPLLPELWDQVYCTLIDAGDNKIYEICGGKGKYNPDEAAVKNTESKYGDNIISIIYNKDNESKTEDEFFAEAKRVAEKFGLKSDKTDKKTYTLFNLSIPQDEPVYFDLIPEKFRAKIAAQNDEEAGEQRIKELLDEISKYKEDYVKSHLIDLAKIDRDMKNIEDEVAKYRPNTTAKKARAAASQSKEMSADLLKVIDFVNF